MREFKNAKNAIDKENVLSFSHGVINDNQV